MKVERRGFFKMLGAGAGAALVPVPSSVPVPAVITGTGAVQLIQLAFYRLGLLGIGEHLSLSDYTFARAWVKPGMTDLELALVLKPYYFVSSILK